MNTATVLGLCYRWHSTRSYFEQIKVALRNPESIDLDALQLKIKTLNGQPKLQKVMEKYIAEFDLILEQM